MELWTSVSLVALKHDLSQASNKLLLGLLIEGSQYGKQIFFKFGVFDDLIPVLEVIAV